MSEYRRKLAEKLGAWKTVNADKKTVERLRKLTGGAGPDTCLECTGKPAPVATAFEAVRNGGKLGIVGEQGEACFNPSRDLIHKEVNVYGAWYFRLHEFPGMVELCNRGLKPKKMVTHRFPLDEAQKGYELMAEGKLQMLFPAKGKPEAGGFEILLGVLDETGTLAPDEVFVRISQCVRGDTGCGCSSGTPSHEFGNVVDPAGNIVDPAGNIVDPVNNTVHPADGCVDPMRHPSVTRCTDGHTAVIEGTVVVACRSGQRSATVVQFLRKSGVPGAVNLEGGILAWSSRIDPGVPRY